MMNKSLPAVFIIASLFFINDIHAKPFQLNNNKDEEIAIKLDKNHPNPFNSLTEIQYFLSKQGHAKLSLYDLYGREVAVLVDKNVKGSWSTIIVNGNGLANGVYFLKLESYGKIATVSINKIN